MLSLGSKKIEACRSPTDRGEACLVTTNQRRGSQALVLEERSTARPMAATATALRPTTIRHGMLFRLSNGNGVETDNIYGDARGWIMEVDTSDGSTLQLVTHS